MGKAALKMASNHLIPPIISGTVVPALKLGQTMVEHPREALVTGGAIAAPITGGASGVLASSLLAGAGAGAGSLAADAGEKVIQSPTAPKTLEESLSKAGKVGAATTVGSILAGGAFKVVGKVGGKILTAIKKAPQTANVKAAGQAISQVEEATGLSKGPLDAFNEPAAADAYMKQLSGIKKVKDLSTPELYKISKNAQTLTNTHPKVSDTPAGTRFYQKVQEARNELYSRVPALGEKVAAYQAEMVKAASDKVGAANKIKAARLVKKLLYRALGGAATGAGLGVAYKLASGVKEVLE